MADDLTPNDESRLPDFPNWEIPPKPADPLDLDSVHEDWLQDWRNRVTSGEITLEKLRNRQQPVDAPFEIL